VVKVLWVVIEMEVEVEEELPSVAEVVVVVVVVDHPLTLVAVVVEGNHCRSSSEVVEAVQLDQH
jgi:hypothetical protein